MKQTEGKKQPEEMDDFERALTRAMRRVEVGPETAAKLLALAANVEQKERREGGRLIRHCSIRHWWTRPVSGGRTFGLPRPAQWLGGALAAAMVLVAAVVGGVEHHDRTEQRLQSERDFALSLQITSQALAQTRLQLRQAGVQLDQ
jgi:hypothetical protein